VMYSLEIDWETQLKATAMLDNVRGTAHAAEETSKVSNGIAPPPLIQ
jgi:hypothetical protein